METCGAEAAGIEGTNANDLWQNLSRVLDQPESNGAGENAPSRGRAGLPLKHPNTTGLILAGGRSTRFSGQDKAFVSLGNKPLLAHVIAHLAPQVNRLVINSNASPERFCEFGLPVIPDRLTGYLGPLAGIHAGLAAWPDDLLLAVAVDLPFLPGNLVEKLRVGWSGEDCRYASDGARHALIVLCPPGMASLVDAFLQEGNHSLQEWLARHGEPVVFGPDNDADITFNINTPADLVRAEHRLVDNPP